MEFPTTSSAREFFGYLPISQQFFGVNIDHPGGPLRQLVVSSRRIMNKL
jgi:hypothetical protein